VRNEQIERAWEPVLTRQIMPRGAMITSRQAGNLQMSGRVQRIGVILSARLIDQKEKGVTVPNPGYGMKLPLGGMHSLGFELYQFSESERPDITNDLARVTNLTVHNTSVAADLISSERIRPIS
jgi:hypothetical protein